MTSLGRNTIKIGFIGLGYRAYFALKRYMHIEGAEIKAICDTNPQQVEEKGKLLEGYGVSGFDSYYGDADAWTRVLDRDDIDLIYISTPWAMHTEMAVYSMKKGKHVAVEVPAAMTVDECWQIVNASEQTGRHCVMLENCCYDPFTLNILNMVQRGVFGEISHAEGAYIHRLCERMIGSDPAYADNWMTEYYANHTGNIYPTHGLGPLAQAMDINRGDRMSFLTSMSSAPRSLEHYMRETFGPGSPQAKIKFKLGTTNTSMIQTALDKTIMLQHDISSPRPYSRINLLSGTQGFSVKYPEEAVALMPEYETYIKGEQLRELMAKYEHPVIADARIHFDRIRDEELIRRGMMDYIMDHRLIYCLRKGLPTDIDVYDGAAWSCITELSEKSVIGGSVPVEIPDFTRGKWKTRERLKFHI